ncbi:MAG: flagellar hook protein FlgE [Firmicutes bacterium]|nr:flagellar hook protein FlgE [Bacillota bacterium]
MGLYGSFYASLSGLSNSASNLSVIGNNLANLNTIGYKGSSTSFQDLFSASLGTQGTQGNGNPIQIGLGTRLGGVTQNFGQGSFQSTNNVTDLAISGQGFFTLTTPGGARCYTRAGNFTVSKAGFLTDPNGNFVMGWNRSGSAVSTNGSPVPVQINPGVTAPPSATTLVGSTTNLDSSAALGTSFTTPMQVYDSLGAVHTLLFTYTKTAPIGTDPVGTTAAWTLGITTDGGATVTGPTRVTFDSSGKYNGPNTNPTLTIAGWTNGATSPTTTWQIFDAATAAPNLTGYASASTTSGSIQDGFGSGTIQSLMVDQNGTIIGSFTNGQTIALAKVALALFSNQNGLSKQGDNTWLETLASGVGNVGAAQQGGRGVVLGGNLELSNVDVAEEFTKLIVAQRGYQANSRVVTTSDELLQETLNLKR